MNWLSQVRTRRRMQDDLRREIRSHLDEKVEALVAEGYSHPRCRAPCAGRFWEHCGRRGTRARSVVVADD